jgi:hypothetical protein
MEFDMVYWIKCKKYGRIIEIKHVVYDFFIKVEFEDGTIELFTRKGHYFSDRIGDDNKIVLINKQAA